VLSPVAHGIGAFVLDDRPSASGRERDGRGPTGGSTRRDGQAGQDQVARDVVRRDDSGMSLPPDTYTHGHHDSVLRSHRWRTADNSAAYLLPHLRAGMSLLDVGCGPGNISTDLARRVRPGRVLAIDRAAGVLDEARELAAAQRVDNIEFRAGDVYELHLESDTFGVVHAHQVLQHLSDPIRALTEMRRVCHHDGVVAVRDSDYGAMRWYPPDPRMDRWNELYREVARGNDAEPEAGRKILEWAQTAGFTEITPSASVWCFATPEDRRWWGGTWSQRVVESSTATQALERGLTTPAELDELAAGWRSWIDEPAGWFTVLHGELLCRG
jgi:ubiquinone/menaquinone biosynthesis C-methylase UbiE